MSGWGAAERGDEPISAWEFRTRYLADGERHDEFYCPFCDIRLSPVLIYKDGELSKSPHFSAKWGEHLNGCDGEPAVINAPEQAPAKAHYKPREMQVPEAFTKRPTPRISQHNLSKQVIPPPSLSDITARKKRASSIGNAIPKTYLLQPIVEACNIILKYIYEKAKSDKWTDGKRNVEIKRTLSAIPLKLEDQTNYSEAFHSSVYLNWTAPRIYHGTGFVDTHDSIFTISCSENAKVNGNYMPLNITIVGNFTKSSPKSHVAIINKLKIYAENKDEFRWYVYGKPEIHSDIVVINVCNPDYLFFKDYFKR